MNRIISWSLLLIRVVLIVLAFMGLTLAGLFVRRCDESLTLAILGCMHVLPLIGIAVMLCRPNIWSALIGASGFAVFASISYCGTVSWAVRGYFSGLGPGHANYIMLYGVLLSFPAVVMQVGRVARRARVERREAIAVPASSPNLRLFYRSMRMIALSAYFFGLLALMSLNFSNFQSNRWTYMYQAYLWPGLCCPDCGINPPENYTGIYRRWGYRGEPVEETQYLEGQLHGRRFLVSCGFGTRGEDHWVSGIQHGVQRYWDEDGHLAAVGTWQNGKPWDGQFRIQGRIVTMRNGEPWTGTFPQFKTGDDGLKHEDGEAIYRDGSVISSDRKEE